MGCVLVSRVLLYRQIKPNLKLLRPPFLGLSARYDISVVLHSWISLVVFSMWNVSCNIKCLWAIVWQFCCILVAEIFSTVNAKYLFLYVYGQSILCL
jgi:hypothetical protein